MRDIHTIEGQYDARDLRFAILATRFNDFIVDRLVSGAIDYPELTLPVYGGDPDGNMTYTFKVTEQTTSGIYYYDVSHYIVTVPVKNWKVQGENITVVKHIASDNEEDKCSCGLKNYTTDSGEQSVDKLDFTNAKQQIGPGPGFDTEILVEKKVNGTQDTSGKFNGWFEIRVERLDVNADGSFTSATDKPVAVGDPTIVDITNGKIEPLKA